MGVKCQVKGSDILVKQRFIETYLYIDSYLLPTYGTQKDLLQIWSVLRQGRVSASILIPIYSEIKIKKIRRFKKK